MADIFLHRLKPDESTTALNAAHKFRIAKKRGDDTKGILKTWNSDKQKKVLTILMNKVQETYSDSDAFAFAIAPSSTKIFVDDLKKTILNTFPNSIDFSGCFSKRYEFEAININRILTETELRERFAIDEKCFKSKLTANTTKMLLVDDVFALGNTFNGMKLLVRDIEPEFELKTAVILKTT